MNDVTATKREGGKLLSARRRVASRLGPLRSRAASTSCELGTQNSERRTRVFRRALSLVELLAVIVILTILVAAVLPTIAPSSEERRMREATRGVTAAFTKARSRALATGRPAGVELERMANEPGASMVLYQVEVPPPFAGYSDTSMVRITGLPSNAVLTFVSGASGGTAEPIPEGLITDGDTIKLNYQGISYEVTNATDGNGDGLYESIEVAFPANVPWTDGQLLPYQITRQPVRTSAAPHQLPEGMVVDLFASGMDSDFFHQPFEPDSPPKNNTDSILIMFSPSGRLDKLSHNEQTDANPDFHTEVVLSPVYLLVGKRQKVVNTTAPPASGPAPPMDPLYNNTDPPETLIENFNWKDLDNRWVIVNPRTGQVSAGEVAFVDDNLDNLPGVNSGDPIVDKVHAGIRASRRLARDMRSLGGN